MMAVVAVLWFANMGGVGGGGIVVPICIIFFGFDAKNAIALSNFSIFISSLQRFLLNAKKPHPFKNGKGLLVDHNMSLIMLPLIISGVSIGQVLNIIMPESIILAFYIVLLIAISIQMTLKAKKLYKKEKTY
jgi:uncharacterized membrane protein YfcA